MDRHLRHLLPRRCDWRRPEIVDANIRRLLSLDAAHLPPSQAICADARHLIFLGAETPELDAIPKNSVQLVITSPPLSWLQKYVAQVPLA